MKLLPCPKKCRRVVVVTLSICVIVIIVLYTLSTQNNIFYKKSQQQSTSQQSNEVSANVEPIAKFHAVQFDQEKSQNVVNFMQNLTFWFESELHRRFWKLYKSNDHNGQQISSNFLVTKTLNDFSLIEKEEAQNLFLETFKNLSLWPPNKNSKFDIISNSRNPESASLGTENSLNNNFEFRAPNYDSRMVAQLLFGMEAEQLMKNSELLLKSKQTKKIATAAWWPPQFENNGNSRIKCPASPLLNERCELRIHRNEENKKFEPVDAYIVGSQAFNLPPFVASDDEKTVRIFITVESPYHSPSLNFSRQNDVLAVYWRGSGVQTPYAKWVYYDPTMRRMNQSVNYAKEKTKMAAIVVSNCDSVNERLAYVRELQKYVDVDIFGRCGHLRCNDRHHGDDGSCFHKLGKEYRFYLAFENSNCRDYITEKFFVNALRNSMIPIVLGAHVDDYRVAAPENSFIHVEEFDSPKQLAHFLHRLTLEDELYNKYFEWRGTGEFIKTNFLCRVCSFLFDHDEEDDAKLHSTSNHNGREERNYDTEFGSWAPNSNLAHPMCLPRGRWYWNRPNDN